MTGDRLLAVAVLVPLCLVLGASVAVLRLYWRAYRELAPSRERLTPLHVALVSAGVVMLEAGLGWGIVQRYADGHPFDLPAILRISMYGVGSLLILAALGVIASVQRRRVRFYQPEVEVELAEPLLSDDEEVGRGG